MDERRNRSERRPKKMVNNPVDRENRFSMSMVMEDVLLFYGGLSGI